MLRPLLPLFILLPLAADALTIGIAVISPPTCSYSNGALQAYIIDGAGGYHYGWSTGDVTSTIYGVAAGTYSVTVIDAHEDVATATIEVPPGNYALQSAWSGLGLCANYGTMVVFPDDLEGPFIGPPPYYVDGQMMVEFPADFVTVFQTTYSIGYPITQGFDQNYTLPFMDGNGCTGTITGHANWLVEWPPITVLEVQGSCANGNNGSIILQTGLEGHLQPVTVGIKPAGGSFLQLYPAGTAVQTRTVSGLAPGEYTVVQYMSPAPYLASSACADSITVTVPDLGFTCGNVSGTAFMDDNLNCTPQGSEPKVPGTVVEILPGPHYGITNAAGTYSVNLPLGNYTIEQLSATLDEHCTGTPIPFSIASGTELQVVNLPDTSLVPLDLQLSIGSGPARPGFPLHYSLNIVNLTPANSGAISLSFDHDPLLSYISSSPAGTVAVNNISWNLPALAAFQQTTVQLVLQVPPDVTLIGTELLSSASATPTNTDANTANNTATHGVIVTGSYDPNEKVARTSSAASTTTYFIGQDEWIDYVLRFQNTGTDTAFNVVVTDTIPPELDLGTFIQGAATHPYALEIREGNVLRFAFYNIQLPDSNVNEPLSHGFVGFRIRPRLPLLAGTQFVNTANIFFDFNPPIITEPSILTAEFSTGVARQAMPELNIYPQPANEQLHLSLANGPVDRLRVLSLDGRLLLNRTASTILSTIQTGSLPSGTYVLVVGAGEMEYRTPFTVLH